MSKVKSTNYVNIQGWMVTDLHLKGNDLLVYAIIYGFTQDGEQWFEGSRQYLAEWCNSTTRGISKNLDSLVKKGYILKETVMINNVRFCKYKASINCSFLGGTKFMGVRNKVHGGEEQSSLRGEEQSSPNKLEDNTLENKDNTYNTPPTPPAGGHSQGQVSHVKKENEEFTSIWKRFVTLIGIKYRNPSEKEKEIIKRWYLDFKLSAELIKLAYDMCIDKKGEYSIKYMNGILGNWFDRGIVSVDQAHKSSTHFKEQNNKLETSYDIEAYERFNIFGNYTSEDKDSQ